MRTHRLRIPVVLAVILLAVTGILAAPEKATPNEKYRWNLEEIYPSPDAWSEAKDEAVADLSKLESCRGHLGESADTLSRCLGVWYDLDRRMSRVQTYANMYYDLDTRVGKSQQMRLQSQQALTQFASASSWIRPEILALGPDRVRELLGSDPSLAPYRQPVEDVLRWAPHTLSPAEEKIVAETGTMQNAGQNVRDVFVNADFPYAEVTLSDGETVRLDAAAYTKYRAATDRADRLKVFHAFFGRYNDYTNTLGTALNAQVQAHVFDARVRHFGSSLEAALFHDNIPTAVYTELLDDVHANLPTLFRYLSLRKRMMGLETLGYEDLYAPIVGKYERTFTPDEAIDLTLAAVAPLGEHYRDVLKQGLEGGWVDWFPRTGKRSGAYSTDVYGLHPFQLQNFTGLYQEVSTLAHESGHSMHTYLADAAQPYPTHDYPIFIAEVASTLNENLLFHTMLDRAKTDDERLFLLGSYLDNLRQTLFRQTQFAEFELRIHEMAEHGEPLSGSNLDELYLKLLREYYGADKGVCDIDPTYRSEWAYIPHMYYDFYVYQYATSVVAAISLAQGILDEQAGPNPSTANRDAYLAMLSAGSSRYAYDMLKDAGVDLATPKPFEAAMAEMNRIMDRMEAILAKGK